MDGSIVTCTSMSQLAHANNNIDLKSNIWQMKVAVQRTSFIPSTHCFAPMMAYRLQQLKGLVSSGPV
jgi:hypothetical protein